ncbi:hypothetical protein ABZV29_38110 [Streptomyces sp. NPDC005236]|uniref:hypothetical protein n=1 Tax=Streptomyces sp. NPDC005236 TaxID=3157028 RepID=UPI0033BD0925
MTTTARSPRLLVLSTVVLAVVGVVLLGVPHGQQPSAPIPVTSSGAHAATKLTSAVTAPSTGQPAMTGTPSTASVTPAEPSVLLSALPPHGEGVAGDRAIQRSLEAAWPADLPVADEQQLLVLGRSLLRADAIGTGRARWPRVFRNPGQALAPAFAAAGFRVQAVIARRDGAADRAVVHLVWAGADRGGTFTDGRITDLYFTRTSPKKGVHTWNPQPRQ